MATMVPPTKGSEYIFYVSLVDQSNIKVIKSNPTLAAGDAKVTTDGNAVTNLDTTPVVDPAASSFVKVTVSATEMNGDNIAILFHDAAGDEWCDLMVNIQTAAQSLDTMDTNIDDIEADTNELQADWHDAGRLDALIDAIKAITDAIPDAGALTTIQADLDNTDQYKADLTTLETRLSAIRAGYLDELAAANLPADIDVLKIYCDILDDAVNGLAAIKAEVEGIGGVPMRGTDNAALAANWTAALATALGNYTAARAAYLDELAAANIPTDVDTLLTRLSAARATLLDEITAARMSELDAANIPADVDNILTAVDPEVATILAEIQNAVYGLAAIRARGDIAWITGAGGAPDVVADAVWDELLAGHIGVGSVGAVLSAAALEATLTAIKGTDWTNETLKLIKELVDELESGEKPPSKAHFKV